jgi:hypothetical protein
MVARLGHIVTQIVANVSNFAELLIRIIDSEVWIPLRSPRLPPAPYQTSLSLSIAKKCALFSRRILYFPADKR